MKKYDLPKAIMFDLDGTLLNTMEGFADLAGELIKREFGLDYATARRSYVTTSGVPFKHQLELLFPKDPRNDSVQKEFEEKKQLVFFKTFPDQDTVDTVLQLKEMGIKVIVSSNNYQELILKYFSKNTSLRFDMILGYKDGFAKGKDHVQHVKKTFDISRKDMIFIGDSLSDGETAKELGIPFVGKIAIRTEAEFLAKFQGISCVKKLSQLLELFDDTKIDMGKSEKK